MADIADLVKAAHEARPADFAYTFKNIMDTKISHALDMKYQEMIDVMANQIDVDTEEE